MKPIPLHKLGAAVLAANAHLLGTVPGVTVANTPRGTTATNCRPAPAPKKASKPRQPTNTEAAAREFLLRTGLYSEVRWNRLTFTLANGHRYTPDLVCIGKDDGALTIVETKGTYRLHSLQRSHLAFDQAKLEWPMFTFAWMERQKDGTWRTS